MGTRAPLSRSLLTRTSPCDATWTPTRQLSVMLLTGWVQSPVVLVFAYMIGNSVLFSTASDGVVSNLYSCFVDVFSVFCMVFCNVTLVSPNMG